jgi:hypothetical protein
MSKRGTRRMPLHRFDGFQVGATSDSSATAGDINSGRSRSEFSCASRGRTTCFA